MKKLSGILCGFILLFSCPNYAQVKSLKPETQIPMSKENLHQFKMTSLTGETFDFSKLKGKKVLVVNTASECGFTPQYKELEAIYKEYQKMNFVVVGFPADNFGHQEPGTNKEIGAFCEKNYGVTFPMMEKSSVKGDDMNEIYKFLTQKSRNGKMDSEVKWNFQKYLIDENGMLVKMLPSKTLPTDPEIISWIKS
jgi:glutathione peroxidase